MAEAPVVEGVTKLLTLDWTQVTVLIGALFSAVAVLVWVIVTGSKNREAECEKRTAAAHERLMAANHDLVEVLREDGKRAQAALDRSSLAVENNTKVVEENRRLVDRMIGHLDAREAREGGR